MKIWIVTTVDGSPSCDHIFKAARTRNVEVMLHHPFDFHLVLAPEEQAVRLMGAKGSAVLPDAVYTRMGSAAPDTILHTVRHFEALGVPCVNSSYSLERVRNKFYCFHELTKHQLPIPHTAFIGTNVAIEHMLSSVPGPPWVVKLPSSGKGRGVVLVESVRSLRSVAEAFETAGQRLIVQEYIPQSVPSDVRVLVIGGKAVAAMRRRAAEGEFRSNLHQGASAEPVPLGGPLQKIAEKTATALKLGIAGIDIMESERGLYVIEANGSPGLAGLQAVNSIDIGGAVLDYIKQCVQQRGD